MMAAILNSTMLDSDTAILHIYSLLSSLRFSLPKSLSLSKIGSHYLHKKTWTQTNSIWFNIMMATILNSSKLNSDTDILDSNTLLSSLRFTQKLWLKLHSDSDSNSFNLTETHSFWMNVMMAAILKSANVDSDTLLSSLRFTQKHSLSTLTMTQTNSIWLKLIHSHSTWWWQQSWILPICIQPY